MKSILELFQWLHDKIQTLVKDYKEFQPSPFSVKEEESLTKLEKLRLKIESDKKTPDNLNMIQYESYENIISGINASTYDTEGFLFTKRKTYQLNHQLGRLLIDSENYRTQLRKLLVTPPTPEKNKISDTLETVQKRMSDFEQQNKLTQEKLSKMEIETKTTQETLLKTKTELDKANSQLALKDEKIHQLEKIFKDVNVHYLGDIPEELGKLIEDTFKVLQIESSASARPQITYSTNSITQSAQKRESLPVKYKVEHPDENSKGEFSEWKKSNPALNDQLKLSKCISSAKYAAICELVWFIKNNQPKDINSGASSSMFPIAPDIKKVEKLIHDLLSPENWEKNWKDSVEKIIQSEISNASGDLLKCLNEIKDFSKYGEDVFNKPFKGVDRLDVLANILGMGHFVPKNIAMGNQFKQMVKEEKAKEVKTNSTVITSPELTTSKQ